MIYSILVGRVGLSPYEVGWMSLLEISWALEGFAEERADQWRRSLGIFGGVPKPKPMTEARYKSAVEAALAHAHRNKGANRGRP